MRVLGVDPGLTRCGVAVLDGGRPPRPVRVAVVRTPAKAATGQRLQVLHDQLDVLVRDAAPEAVALERVFFTTNVTTGIGVAQAAGIVLLVAAQHGLPVVEYTPTQVKAAIAGSGDADKAQVGYMVRALLGLREVPRPADAADAVALALCHLSSGAGRGTSAMSARLAAAVAAATPGAQVVAR